jgi:transketolase
MQQGRDLRDALYEALIELAAENPKVLLLDSDVALATKVIAFKKAFPDRFIQLGVAEQNTISFAAGLANAGYIPLVNVFAAFASRRSLDQVYVHLAYARSNVKILAGYAGLTTPNTGATHQEQISLAVMRTIPNLVVIEPADEPELRSALRIITEYSGPVYLRLSRTDVNGGPIDVSLAGYSFKIGMGCTLRDGHSVTLIGCGLMTSRCLAAAEILEDEGVSARVINMSSIKPIDEDLLVHAAVETGCIVTAENHTIIGGLGGAVAEVIGERCPVPIIRVGIRDAFGESGALSDLHEKYGLTPKAVIDAARRALRMKSRSGSTV